MDGWLPLTPDGIASILRRNACPDGSRNWAHHVRLMTIEPWRSRHVR
jgi:hypothetical protein